MRINDFETIEDYNNFNNHETLHPLVSVIDYSKSYPRTGSKMFFGLYCVILKDVECGNLIYGRHNYDYQKGTLVFLSPGQVVDASNKTIEYQPKGHGLIFHSDLLIGSSLARDIDKYKFFSYQLNEALHLSDQERKLILDCLFKIESEISRAFDKHSKKLIVANIELFLNYCERFYDRQFITREHINKGIVENFEDLLNDYLKSNKLQELGFPTVSYCAEKLNLSSNYFGDLIKKETGKSAQDYIQSKVIFMAKEKVFDPNKSISEVAYELGFKYPQHFTRLFKKKVGMTPNEYRQQN